MIDERQHIQTPFFLFVPWAEMIFVVAFFLGLPLKLFGLLTTGESLLLLGMSGLSIVFFLYAFAPGKIIPVRSGHESGSADRMAVVTRRFIFVGLSLTVAGLSLDYLRISHASPFLILGIPLLLGACAGGYWFNHATPDRMHHLKGALIRSSIVIVIGLLYGIVQLFTR